MRLVFIHGWAFDQTFWNLLRALTPGIPSLAVDLGFLQNARDVPDFSPKDVLVGHSLGFAWGISAYASWKGWIAINGFARFAGDEESGGCVSASAIRALRRNLSADPPKTVADFYKNISHAAPCPALNPDALLEGLNFLQTVNASVRNRPNGLVLADENDPLVPQTATAHLARQHKDTKIHWHKNGGHLLPLTAAAWCAEKVLEHASGLE